MKPASKALVVFCLVGLILGLCRFRPYPRKTCIKNVGSLRGPRQNQAHPRDD